MFIHKYVDLSTTVCSPVTDPTRAVLLSQRESSKINRICNRKRFFLHAQQICRIDDRYVFISCTLLLLYSNSGCGVYINLVLYLL